MFTSIIFVHVFCLFETVSKSTNLLRLNCMFSVWIVEFLLCICFVLSPFLLAQRFAQRTVRGPKYLHPNDSIVCSAFSALLCGFVFIPVSSGVCGCSVGGGCVMCVCVFFFSCKSDSICDNVLSTVAIVRGHIWSTHARIASERTTKEFSNRIKTKENSRGLVVVA